MNSQHFLLVNPPNLFPLLEIATGFLVLLNFTKIIKIHIKVLEVSQRNSIVK